MPDDDHPPVSTAYDDQFLASADLTWLPWVGANYPRRPKEKKLLLVAESHYVNVNQPEQLEAALKEHRAYRTYTREVIHECAILQDWKNRTLDAIPKILFGTADIDRARFWSDTGYYNFIQRQMHYNREGSPERPGDGDFLTGWKVFLQVAAILQPSHCLFLGVEASNSFEHAMQLYHAEASGFRWTGKTGRTYGREARLQGQGQATELYFIQHPGKYFSPEDWREHLGAQFTGLMGWLHDENYETLR